MVVHVDKRSLIAIRKMLGHEIGSERSENASMGFGASGYP